MSWNAKNAQDCCSFVASHSGFVPLKQNASFKDNALCSIRSRAACSQLNVSCLLLLSSAFFESDSMPAVSAAWLTLRNKRCFSFCNLRRVWQASEKPAFISLVKQARCAYWFCKVCRGWHPRQAVQGKDQLPSNPGANINWWPLKLTLAKSIINKKAQLWFHRPFLNRPCVSCVTSQQQPLPVCSVTPASYVSAAW